MLLREILSSKGTPGVHTIHPSATCDDAVAELVRYNIGSLLVRDSPVGPVLGIVTERDILRAQAAHREPLDRLCVALVMTTDLITANAEDHMLLAMRLMTEHRVRHLPVVHGDQLVGIVSIGDIVKTHHDELEQENHYMRSYIRGEGGEVATVQD